MSRDRRDSSELPKRRFGHYEIAGILAAAILAGQAEMIAMRASGLRDWFFLY
jgi:sulfopyruvate decarboxylase TPP-binding subunit